MQWVNGIRPAFDRVKTTASPWSNERGTTRSGGGVAPRTGRSV